jgi:hypothetical protein
MMKGPDNAHETDEMATSSKVTIKTEASFILSPKATFSIEFQFIICESRVC